MQDQTHLYIRMKQAVQWLKQNKQMLQKDIAAKMGISKVAFSNGMKRIQLKFDEDFVISFHQATGQQFPLEWLLYGTGDMFQNDCNNKIQGDNVPAWADSLINLVGNNTKDLESLRKENVELRKEISALRETLNSILIKIQTSHKPAIYDEKDTVLPIAAEYSNLK